MNPQLLLQWLIWGEGYHPLVYLDTLGFHTIGIGFLLDGTDPTTGIPTRSPRIANIVNTLLGANIYDRIRNGTITLTSAQIMILYNYSVQQAMTIVRKRFISACDPVLSFHTFSFVSLGIQRSLLLFPYRSFPL